MTNLGSGLLLGPLAHCVSSGASTNLKVKRPGRTQPPPPLVGSESTILVVLVSAFVVDSTVWSFSCLQKGEDTCPSPPRALRSRRHCP